MILIMGFGSSDIAEESTLCYLLLHRSFKQVADNIIDRRVAAR